MADQLVVWRHRGQTLYLYLVISLVAVYCKRANIRGGFNFAMFVVDIFSAKLKPPRSFNNASVFSYLLVYVRSYTIIREIKTTAKGPIKKIANF